ncbi:MAG: hypothetical protein GF313_10250, partial [Caldithrix sp.]|nr:hypothetical protein [Caldithrix sp.]
MHQYAGTIFIFSSTICECINDGTVRLSPLLCKMVWFDEFLADCRITKGARLFSKNVTSGKSLRNTMLQVFYKRSRMVHSMRLILLIFILSVYLFEIDAQESKQHHTVDGFRNPFSGFEERDTKDLMQWSVWERLKGEKPERPDSYKFETVQNDGQRLRENKTQTTVTWIGHSTLLIQTAGLNILTDPIWSDRCSPVSFAGPRRHVQPGLDFYDLPPIDMVLISHNHYDHLDKNTIRRLGDRPLYIVPLGLGAFFRNLGIKHYTELDWWDELTVNGVRFVCTPAQHFSGRSLWDKNKTLWASWSIIGKDKR